MLFDLSHVPLRWFLLVLVALVVVQLLMSYAAQRGPLCGGDSEFWRFLEEVDRTGGPVAKSFLYAGVAFMYVLVPLVFLGLPILEILLVASTPDVWRTYGAAVAVASVLVGVFSFGNFMAFVVRW